VGKMSEQLGTIINRKRMSVSIIGAGVIGSNVARLLAKSRISARIANKHGPESLGRLVRELGPWITASTVEEAASA
jgi:predicted dinucleotide-binding enzyme